VNNDKLCVFLDKFFSNTISADNCGSLMACLAYGRHDLLSVVVGASLKNAIDSPMLYDTDAKDVFERIKTAPRFKIQERRTIMA
jgi:hypothetical protein